MRVNEKRGRFGTMEPLGREDFVREVTEGSRVSLDDAPDQNEEEEDEAEGGKPSGRLRGTGVVVFLYKDSYVLPPRVSAIDPA